MSLRRSTELLARLEKHALDQARLTLQALEFELARQQESLAVAERRLAGEHASASYEASAVKRELPRDRSKVELRVMGNGRCPSNLVSGRIG